MDSIEETLDAGRELWRRADSSVRTARRVVKRNGRRNAPADAPAGDNEFFEKKIRPIFVEHCYECHRAGKSKGNLKLDSSTGWMRGGDSGAAVVPGKPDESLLIHAVRHDGLDMPPAGKLSDEKIRLLEQWVARGAISPPDEHDAARPAGQDVFDLEAGRKFWAYQAPREASLPLASRSDLADHPIDCFVPPRLEAAKLCESPEAERAVLVRRLFFDLCGLPPLPAEIDACEQDDSPNWYEKLVDRLLASPHFGEHWGRHWLDLVRFGESLTLRGFILPDAWRYRDYVIESFNRDRPYDRFVREQIAGDLLPAASLEDHRRQLIATTFLALGNTNLEEQDNGNWKWTWLTSSSMSSVRRSLAKPSDAHAVTTTSSIQFPRVTTMRWLASCTIPNSWNMPTFPSGTRCRCPCQREKRRSWRAKNRAGGTKT